jgi:hypothetical protein
VAETLQTDQTDLVEGGPAFRSAPHFDERRHHAQTASRITFTLLAITAATVLIHFASVIAADLFERPALTGSLAKISAFGFLFYPVFSVRRSRTTLRSAVNEIVRAFRLCDSFLEQLIP